MRYSILILTILWALIGCQPMNGNFSDLSSLNNEDRQGQPEIDENLLPALSTQVSSQDITIHVTGTFLEFVDFYLDKEISPLPLRNEATDGSYRITLPFTGLSAGEHEIRVVAGVRILEQVSTAIRYVSFTVPQNTPTPDPEPTPAPGPTPAPTPALSMSISNINAPASALAGDSIETSFRVRASRAVSNINVHVGLYSESGDRIASQLFSAQSFSNNQRRTYSWNFRIPTQTASDKYTYGIDVFNSDFSVTYVSMGQDLEIKARPVATPTPVPTPPPVATPLPSADIIWSADHETGSLSQWSAGSCGGLFTSGGGTASASTNFARSGRHSARLTISNVNGDQGTRLFRWCESQRNQELYYSAWFYFPERFDTIAGWWNIFQFKSKTSSKNDPFFLLDVGNRSNGNMYVYMYDWQNRRSYSQNLADIPVGRWVHFEIFFRSAGDNTGRVTVWQDGQQLFDVNNVRTRYPDGDSQWSVNNYTSSIRPDPAHIYVDDAVISRTRVGPNR